MARDLNHRDARAILTLLVKEVTGQNPTTQIVDTSTFVSAGEQIMSYGKENVLNALSIVVGRFFATSRPYKAKLNIIRPINSGVYSNRIRKVSVYSEDPEHAGSFNTNLYTNFANGYDNGTNGTSAGGGTNSVQSMWVQNVPDVLEMNFAGSSTWDDSLTLYEWQYKYAFNNEDEFLKLISAIKTEKQNDIETQKEVFTRMCLLNYIAGIYDMSANMPLSVRDLTKMYNEEKGLTGANAKTREEILRDDLEGLLKIFVEDFKLTSDKMSDRSTKYHWTPARGTKKILRHTPKDKQKAILYNPLFLKAKTNVLPSIFNPEYLSIDNFEGVNYWQNELNPTEIKVTPAIPDTSTGVQTAGEPVNLPYVVGTLFDSDAAMVDYQLESSSVTPLEARKHFRNIWWNFARNSINDFTENGVIYIMS